MFNKLIFALTAMLLLGACKSQSISSKSSKPVSHAAWDNLLKKHVTDDGWVDYAGFVADSTELTAYLKTLSENPPDKRSWPKDEQMAYWINAYNAFTVEIVRKHYPIKSIKDIGPKVTLPFVNTVWDIKFIHIGDENYDLNNIEHKMLRKQFGDPRIHFAIVCASFSCPKLLNEAYVGDRLNEQLNKQARSFVNDGIRNRISPDNLNLSKIFSWYKGDFTKSGDLKSYIRQFANIDFQEDADVKFADYDWSLNAQK